MEFHHISVLLEECLEGLHIRPEGIYLDGTAGGAGHSVQIAKRLTSGRLLALDKDPEAVAAASQRLAPYPGAKVIQSDFSRIPEVLEQEGIAGLDGILLDLGVSSHQLDTPERGFSYHSDAPLDMRMSKEGFGAYDLVNSWPPEEIARVLREYGEEKFAFQIARAIVRRREEGAITTTLQLADVVKSAIPAAARREGGHPAKRSFQAIRIAVNGELESLSQCLDRAFDCLRPGGRFCVITFHSLEDRMVKQKFAGYCKGCICPPDFPICVCGKTPRGRLVSRKPVEPTPEELERNNRSRSAKLRILEKLTEG